VGYGIVNPVAAVTTALSPPMPAASPTVAAPLARPPSDAALRRTTAAVASGSIGVTAVVLAGWAALRRGRRRRWAPGRAPTAAPPAVAAAPAAGPLRDR
jgi:hypothetical protein